MSCSFEIVPIPGREVLQRNFAKLPEKSDAYSNRPLTLNERFSIIERGYYLRPIDRQEGTEKLRTVKIEPLVKFGTTEEIITEMRAELDKKKKPNKNNQSNHATPTGSPISSKEGRND